MTIITIFMGAVILLLAVLSLWLFSRVRALKGENGLLRERLHVLGWSAAANDDTATATGGSPSDNDAELFAFIDQQIDEKQLYLDPDFDRTNVCRLTGLSKERVGQLVKRYSGACNLQVYVNRKRVAYARQLMVTHAHYSMEAVANECGIGNLSTFYRIFKQVYGLPPAEFRRTVVRDADGG